MNIRVYVMHIAAYIICTVLRFQLVYRTSVCTVGVKERLPIYGLFNGTLFYIDRARTGGEQCGIGVKTTSEWAGISHLHVGWV